jgi:hypothetical protein
MKPIQSTLSELRGGLAAEELGEALRTLTQAVRETGKKGSVLLRLHVIPDDGEGQVERIRIEDDIEIRLPKPKKRASIFFINEHNDLLRQLTIPGVDGAEMRVTK